MTAAAVAKRRWSTLPKVVRETIAYLPTSIVPMGVGFATLLVFVRMLSPERYGAYILAMATVSTVNQVLGDWIATSTLRLFPEANLAGTAKELIATIKLCMAGAALISLVIVPLLLRASGKSTYIAPALFLALVTITAKVAMNLLRANLLTSRFVAISIATPILSLAASVCALKLTGRPEAILWAICAVGVVQITFALRTPSLRQVSRAAWRTKFSPQLLRSILQFGLPMALTGIGGQALLLADRFLLAILRGDAEAGLYAANYSLGEKSAALAFAPIFSAMYPLLANAWSEQRREESARLLRHAASMYLCYCVPLLAVLMFGSGVISRHFLTPEYARAHDVIWIVAAGTMIWNFGILLHQGLEMSKRTIVITGMVLGSAIVNIVLNLILIPPYGYRGAAWATLLSYALYLALARYLSFRLVGFRWNISLPWSAATRPVQAVVPDIPTSQDRVIS